MPTLSFPYGKTTLPLHIPHDRLASVLESGLNTYRPAKTQQQLVQDALEHPMGTPRLCELAKNKQRIVIIASDHTRPVPSKILAPLMLEEIRRGNPFADITFLIATGCHRRTTRGELIDKFGGEIVEQEKIYIHDCDDDDMLVSLGALPSGGELMVNRLAVEADLLVSEGFIEPHFFAGFSGGRKSVLPGIAARKTVLYNHNAAFIQNPNARTGSIDENPIHRDMLFAAEAVGLDFICNVVINSRKEIVYAVAGDVDKAHLSGCAFVEKQCQAPQIPADIVIATNGGYPLDQNIYQSVKGLTAAEACVRPGGVIIMAAQCADGHGGKAFYEAFLHQKNLAQLTEEFLRTPADKTRIDQWEAQIFARVLRKASVIFVSEASDDMVSDLHMLPAHSLPEALEKADALLSSDHLAPPKILAIPDGISVIIKSSPRKEQAL